MGFSPSVTFGDSSLQQSRKAANLMVCRSAFSRLPTAQLEIEARHRCLQPATSRCESYGFQHRRCRNPAQQGLRCVPSGGAKERAVVTLPSSDEEGGKTAGFDGRRDNAPADLRRFSGSAKGASLPQSPPVTAPPSGGAKERAAVTLAFL